MSKINLPTNVPMAMPIIVLNMILFLPFFC
nr:MAG TPA: hypothetical protein [Caudoviricetes sp.]